MQTFKELKAENEILKEQEKNNSNKISELEKIIEWYHQQLKLKQQKMFGSSSEQDKYNGVDGQCCLLPV